VCKLKQDIADAAYRKRRGRPQLPGLGKVIADVLFSLLLQGLFLIQVTVSITTQLISLFFFMQRFLLSLLELCPVYKKCLVLCVECLMMKVPIVRSL